MPHFVEKVCAVPSYYFQFVEGDAEEKFGALELDGDDEARAEGLRAARELLAEGIHVGIDRSDWQSTIYRETGEVIANFRFSDLIEKRGGLR